MSELRFSSDRCFSRKVCACARRSYRVACIKRQSDMLKLSPADFPTSLTITKMAPLVIAFFYESFSLYRSRGYSFEDCVELDQDETIEAIVQSLRSNGYEVVLVGDVKELVSRMAKGEHEQWDLAFSISEGMHGVGREAQVPGLLEAYRIPHVLSDAATLALCLDKGKTKVWPFHYKTRI